MKKLIISLVFFMECLSMSSQNKDTYQVYALNYTGNAYSTANNWAVGANKHDSIQICAMVWLLKGENGKNILIDAGYIDTSKNDNIEYIRPDLLLKTINLDPADITDVILTHPDNDHIGGINLFPESKVWMQEDDFNYFVGKYWQESDSSKRFNKNDVRNLIEINLQGRLKLIKGDNIEIFPGIRVYIGSKHTFENQYLLVNSNSKDNKILIASDAIWVYYNLDKLVSIPWAVLDQAAYVEAMKRMKTLVTDPNLIIPGHDAAVFTRFPLITDRIVKIGN